MAELTLDADEYPALSGLKEGDPVSSISCKDAKVVSVVDGQVTVDMGLIEVEAEGVADKELRKMRGEPSVDVEGLDDDEEVD